MGKKQLPQQVDAPEHSARLTPRSKENQCIALAYSLVEKRLREGTATSQETTYFLKLGSTMQDLEKQELRERVRLLRAKTESMETAKRVEEKIDAAMDALRSYASPTMFGNYEFHE